jgi:NAD(P)-dependent dehydrogenase (short-subunit alcohol dehydrogenase family)
MPAVEGLSMNTTRLRKLVSQIEERNFMKLSDCTILITGGSAGIGLAFARKFLELGNQVIVTGRRQSSLDEVRARYPKIHTIQSDVETLRRFLPSRSA